MVNLWSSHGDWEYHETLIPKAVPKTPRVWLAVGEYDNGAERDEAGRHNWVLEDRRMVIALKAKGH